MAKFPEAERRIFHRVFVCRKCKSTLKTDNQKIKLGKAKCRKCGSKALRPKNKERKG